MCLRSVLITGLTCFATVSACCEAARFEIDGLTWSSYPPSAGDSVWFDVLIDDPMGEWAQNIQLTFFIEPLGIDSLAFDAPKSQAVENDPDYWLLGNSDGAGALDLGEDKYQFGDNPEDGMPVSLGVDDIAARFAFTWDGNAGDYSVTVDTEITNTYIMDEGFNSAAPSWVASQVTLRVPEPATVLLLVVGAFIFVWRLSAG